MIDDRSFSFKSLWNTQIVDIRDIFSDFNEMTFELLYFWFIYMVRVLQINIARKIKFLWKIFIQIFQNLFLSF